MREAFANCWFLREICVHEKKRKWKFKRVDHVICKMGDCFASIIVVKIHEEIFVIFPVDVFPVALCSMTGESMITVTMKILKVDGWPKFVLTLSCVHSMTKKLKIQSEIRDSEVFSSKGVHKVNLRRSRKIVGYRCVVNISNHSNRPNFT